MTTDYEYNLVSLNSIIYVEAAKDNIELHTSEKVYRIHEGIKSFTEKNCPDFIFVHRSYAVNTDWIKSVSTRLCLSCKRRKACRLKSSDTRTSAQS